MAMNVASSTSMSTNLAQKLRMEIKAKLLELTGEHEEELPDYIMVMVANQRSKYQMQDELNLFLDSQTEEFVNWLHSDALKRLGDPGDSKNKSDSKSDRKRSLRPKSESGSEQSSRQERSKKDKEKSAPIKSKSPPPKEPSLKAVVPEVETPPERTPTPETLKRQEDDDMNTDEHQRRSASPPSPVIIINNKAIQQQQQMSNQMDSDDEIDQLRQTVAASRKKPPQAVKIARVAPAPLVSTIARVIRAPPTDYDDEEDGDDANDRGLSSVIKIKERTYVPQERQASRRLFMQQTAFLRAEKGSRDQQIDPQDDEDLRNVLKRKRKRDWNRVENERTDSPAYMTYNDQVVEEYEPQIVTQSLPATEARNTRFIVTLDGAVEKKMKFDSDLEEDVEINIDEPSMVESPTNVRCRFYPNCRNADCPFSHEPDETDTSKILCKWFPNCQFKSMCKYKHPHCKFDRTCSNPACSYKHSFGYRPGATATAFRPSRPVAFADRSKFTWTKK